MCGYTKCKICLYILLWWCSPYITHFHTPSPFSPILLFIHLHNSTYTQYTYINDNYRHMSIFIISCMQCIHTHTISFIHRNTYLYIIYIDIKYSPENHINLHNLVKCGYVDLILMTLLERIIHTLYVMIHFSF